MADDPSSQNSTPSREGSDVDHDHRDDHDHDGHDHDHSHGGGHVHAPKDFGTAFAIGVGLNAAFIIVEVAAGIAASSVALLADAGHNLSDVLGLLIAWGASILDKLRPTLRYTYGYKSSTILAALANAMLLLIAVGAIALEAVQRLGSPPAVNDMMVIVVAGIGVVINGFTAMLFMSGRESDVNIRGAYLHMAADAGISMGVVVAGIVMFMTGWDWLDPVVSLAIAVVIVWATWGLLRDSTRLALQAVPDNINPELVRSRLAALPGVASLHDLHIWPMSTTETALTCHLVMPDGHPGDAFISNAANMLREEFQIRHATLQLEIGNDAPCGLSPSCAGSAPCDP
ncbi:cation transporter [Hyphomicrobium methylovorum]|uniref:cation diffusion facilitator family transporter n=1 Tax=Hyphomicrobium methylovorum TaxID=84 RepID=UPI0015E6E219|nr:cation diffusion facilitator family transporter [Hyphomicrobium methylovorum]MBA2125347.1 cation transporter [Hyphomicrobium methylovorum]